MIADMVNDKNFLIFDTDNLSVQQIWKKLEWV